MEPWQKEHIRQNLPELVRTTDFNAYVIALLRAKDIISDHEAEHLSVKRNMEGKFVASSHGYDILQTRKFAYKVLIEALEETNQTGALQVLRRRRASQANQQQLTKQPLNFELDNFLDSVTPANPNSISIQHLSQVSDESPSIPPPNSSATYQPLGPHTSTSSNTSPATELRTTSNLFSPIQTSPTTEQIKYSESDILGTGSGGTFVCRGKFGQRDVAVKILSNLKDKSEAENEIEKLLKCDEHVNIVKYYHSEKTPNGFLIALDLCEKLTLEDWVVDSNCFQVDIDPLDVLRQATQGLGFLHQPKINIIHRDLKPSNILFSIQENKAVVKISDFGISRTIHHGQTKRTFTSFGGTFGWTAAEVLEAESALTKLKFRRSPIPTVTPKMTNKIDIFSLGCVYYFVLTQGEHPFGDDEDLKNRLIRNGEPQLRDEYDSLRLQCNLALVENMIAKDPNIRPNTEYILAHPMFWNHRKMIAFIDEVSNFVTNPVPSNKELCDKLVAKLERNLFPKISKGSPDGWFGSLDSTLKPIFLKRYKEADKNKAIELVRKIRNFKHHYTEPNLVQIKAHIGELPDAFMTFWLKMFPSLINEMRDAFDDLKSQESFKCYF